MKLGFVRAANPAAVRIDVISPELNSAGFTALILKSIPPFMCEPHTSCFIRKPHDKFKKKKRKKNPRGSPVSTRSSLQRESKGDRFSEQPETSGQMT